MDLELRESKVNIGKGSNQSSRIIVLILFQLLSFGNDNQSRLWKRCLGTNLDLLQLRVLGFTLLPGSVVKREQRKVIKRRPDAVVLLGGFVGRHSQVDVFVRGVWSKWLTGIVTYDLCDEKE